MNRRDILAGGAASAALVVLPSGIAGAAVLPRLRALDPIAPDVAARLQRGIAQWEPAADDLSIPIEKRLIFQHVCARRYLRLAWPDVDALARFEEIAERWPLLRPNISRAMQARIEEREGWDSDGGWDYAKVRIDDGPPPRAD